MIIVTGSTGFLGAHLLLHLAVKGNQITALKRSVSSTKLVEKVFSWYSPKNKQLLRNIEWVTGDILDIHSLLNIFEMDCEVYHTAAIVSFNSKDKKSLLETNINGTINVVNAALQKKVRKLVYVSSVAALGQTVNTEITNEESEWKETKGMSSYSFSKFEAEHEVWRGIAEGLNAVIVNPSIILGPGNWSKGSSRLFTTVYKGLKFYTKGSNGFVDVKDVAKAMIVLMESDFSGKRYILNSENIAYKQLFDWMANAFGVVPPKIKVGKFLGEILWRILAVASLFSRIPPFVTKETARTANNTRLYSAENFIKATGIKFIPIKQSIAQTATIFLSEHSKKSVH